MASEVYANAKYLMATDQLGWVNSLVRFRAMLVNSAYVFNWVHTTVADVIAGELAGGTYQRVDMTGRTVVLDMPGNRALAKAPSTIFPSLSGTTSSPSGLIVYKQIGGNDFTPGDDPLICFVDFPTTAPNGDNFLVQYDPGGVFALTKC